MHLELSDEEAAALARELHDIVENDRYPFSPRIRTLRAILAKLRPEPVRASPCRLRRFMRRREPAQPEGVAPANREWPDRTEWCSKANSMADEKAPVNWYAVVSTGSHPIQPYLAAFELLTDPKLLPFERDGQKLGKLSYSGFVAYADYEGVLKETRELISVLTGALRIRQGPAPLSILNIVGVFEDGREKQFPPHGRPTRAGSWGIPTWTRMAGVEPWPTTEQLMVEYIVRSGDRLAKDVLGYMSSSPDFFNLFKVLEVIRWDLGKGDIEKGYRLVWERGWVTEEKLRAFSFTANKAHRHWDKNHPAPQMDLDEARIMFGLIIEEWIAERAGLRLPPVDMRPGRKA
jgi:hypothetical protein